MNSLPEGFSSSHIILSTLEETSSELGEIYELNNTKVDSIVDVCALVDRLVGEFEAESIGVKVDPISLEITIFMSFLVGYIEGKNNALVRLSSKANSIRFSPGENDLVELSMAFPGVWDSIFV